MTSDPEYLLAGAGGVGLSSADAALGALERVRFRPGPTEAVLLRPLFLLVAASDTTLAATLRAATTFDTEGAFAARLRKL